MKTSWHYAMPAGYTEWWSRMQIESISPAFNEAVEEYLGKVPSASAMESREVVRRALEFAEPPRIPFSSVVPLSGDFCEVRILELLRADSSKKKRSKGDIYYDEWGVGLEVTGREWDQATDHPLKDLQTLNKYRFPGITPLERYDWYWPYLERAHEAGKYVVGRDPVMMFERLRMLCGFEEIMLAPYTHPQELRRLVDRLTEMTIDVVEYWAGTGRVDAFMTIQDWGLQTSLQMEPEMFRRFYKNRYVRVAAVCHQQGMHYIWHCCGWIMDIISDMIEIGVDAVQLDQPRLMGHRRLAERFGGKISFWNTVDIQWLTQPGLVLTDEQLQTEVREMIEPFRGFPGGLMLRQYIAPKTIGISEHALRVLHQAFGDYEKQEKHNSEEL